MSASRGIEASRGIGLGKPALSAGAIEGLVREAGDGQTDLAGRAVGESAGTDGPPGLEQGQTSAQGGTPERASANAAADT